MLAAMIRFIVLSHLRTGAFIRPIVLCREPHAHLIYGGKGNPGGSGLLRLVASRWCAGLHFTSVHMLLNAIQAKTGKIELLY